MKRKHFTGLVLLTVILYMLFSCTKIVNIELPTTKPKPVVFSLIENKHTVKLYFNNSYNILDYVDSNHLYSDKADIKCYLNGQYQENLYYKEGYFYTLNTSPNPGDTIAVIVSPENGQQQLFAETVIPSKISIDTIVFTDSVFHDQDETYYSSIQLSFNDPAGRKNFYEIYIRAKCLCDETVEYESVMGYHSDDPVITSEGIITPFGSTGNADFYDTEPVSVIFSDSLFSGENVLLNIAFMRPCEYVTGQYQPCKFALSVYLSNVTKEYYLYRKTLYKHLISQESNLWSGYVEPIQMYSNIKGGLGVFAGYTCDSATVNPN